MHLLEISIMFITLKRLEQQNRNVLNDISNIPKQKQARTRSALKPKKLFSLPTVVSKLPLPQAGNQYQPREFISIMSTRKKGTTSRAKVIEHILANKLVPVKQSSLYAVLSKHAKGEIVCEKWNDLGPPYLMSKKVLGTISNELNVNDGDTISTDFIQKNRKNTKDGREKPRLRTNYKRGYENMS